MERVNMTNKSQNDAIRKFARCVLVAEMMDSVHGGGLLKAAKKLSGGEAEAASDAAEKARAAVKAVQAKKGKEGTGAASGLSKAENKSKRLEEERWEFPPRTRMGSLTCMEAGCRNEFVVDGRERKRVLEKGFKLPKRCPACRRNGKSRYRVLKPGKDREKAPDGRGGALDPKEDRKKKPSALRWKSNKAKAKPRRSQTRAGVFSATMTMLVACR